jgi:hypothetical protein
MNPSNLLFGCILLVAGRKFFWLFVGIVGFLMGMTYAGQLFPGAPDWIVFLIAITLGTLGALIAVAAQWIVVVLAGFAGAGYFAMLMTQMFTPTELSPVIFLVGGVIGAIVMIVAFDLALAALSSFLGAALIVGALGMKDPIVSVLAVVGLAVVGIMIQNSWLKGSKKT